MSQSQESARKQIDDSLVSILNGPITQKKVEL